MSDHTVISGSDTVVAPGGADAVLAGTDVPVVDAALLAGTDTVLDGADPVVQTAGLTVTGVLTVVVPSTDPAWTDLGQDSAIAALTNDDGGYSDVRARTIHCVTPYDDKVFLGCGDFTGNAGPVPLRYYDLASPGFASGESSVATESIYLIRVADGDLWAVCNDPEAGSDPDYVHYDGSTFTEVSRLGIDAAHLFDLISWDGAIWLSGQAAVSGDDDGAIWYSTNGGANWTKVTLTTLGRIHALLDVDGYLWTQNYSWSTDNPASTAIRSSDGTSWSSTSVNLLPQNEGTLWKPWIVGGVGAYLTQYPLSDAGGTIYLTTFDGTTVDELTDIGAVYDHHFDGTTLYVLTQAGEILTTTDLAGFDLLTDEAPSGARSVCALDGAVYVGTTDSHLWVYG